jgi:hypothetical protein
MLGPRDARQRCRRVNFLGPEPTSQLEPVVGQPEGELKRRHMFLGAPGYCEKRRLAGRSKRRKDEELGGV